MSRSQLLPALRRPFVTRASSEPYDVVIVGAGMVGAALAALLGSNSLTRSLRIAVLDQKVQPSVFFPQPVPDLRVSTLTPATVRCLQRAGAWDAVAPPNSAAFSEMQVWDAASGSGIKWDARDVGSDTMGFIAENSMLQASLLAAAARHSSDIEFVWPASLTSLHLPLRPWAASPPLARSHADATAGDMASSSSSSSSSSGSNPATTSAHVEFIKQERILQHLHPGSSTARTSSSIAEGDQREKLQQEQRAGNGFGGSSSNSSHSSSSSSSNLAVLTLKDGRQLHSRLVVAADGAGSKVRELAGLRTFGWDYRQRGVVAAVRTDVPHATAWQAFLPTGPMALLPTRDGFSNIVWSTTPDIARQLEAMSPSEFAAAAHREMQRGAGQATAPPPRIVACEGAGKARSFPLRALHSGAYVAPRLALIGDAAHAVHPLAGQGVNLGFGDAEALASALAEAKASGQDVGDVLLLRQRYERPRQAADMAMATALDSVKFAFGQQAPPLVALRSLGLGLFNWAGPVKNQVMKFAMGL